MNRMQLSYLLLGAILAIFIAVAVGFGCRCGRMPWEGFKAGDAADGGKEEGGADTKTAAGKRATAPPALNTKEQELFDNLTKNRLSDKEIEKLVRAGILTENLVEKFLSKLDKDADPVTKPDLGGLEGFASGPRYAAANAH